PLLTYKEDEGLGKNEYRLQINDLRWQIFHGLEGDEFLVNAGKEDLLQINTEGRPSWHPTRKHLWHIVKETGGLKEKLQASGFKTWDPAAYMELHLMEAIRLQADSFLTLEIVEFELSNLSQRYPDLIAGFQQKFQKDFLIRLLRELLREEISIRDLTGIMEASMGAKTIIDAEFSEKLILIPSQYTPLFSTEGAAVPEQPDPLLFSETVRVSQKAYVTGKFAKGKGTLWVFLLDPTLEKLFLDPLPQLQGEKKY